MKNKLKPNRNACGVSGVSDSFITHFCNIRGLATNLNPVHQHLQSVRPHLLFLTETQISPPTSSSHLCCPGYRLHSVFRHHAGICVFVLSEVAATHLEQYDVSTPEYQVFWLKICHLGHISFTACVYRSPSYPDASPLMSALEMTLEKLVQEFPTADFSILGDFNVHHSDWLASKSTDAAGVEVESFSVTNNLTQLVNQPTRIPDRAGDTCNILDLLMTSSPNSYSAVHVTSPIGSSDHCLISAVLPTKSSSKHRPEKRTLWKYASADWDGLRDYFGSYPWNQFCFTKDAHHAEASICHAILEGMKLFIPHSNAAGRCKSPKWFTNSCAVAVHNKNISYSNWKANPTPDKFNNYCLARNVCKHTINLAKSDFLMHVAQNLANCPNGSKSFWSLASRITNNFCGSSIPPLIDSNGIVITTPNQKADLLAKVFSSNSIIDDTNVQTPIVPPATHFMPKITFLVRHTRRFLSSLDPSKSAGPDGIPGIVLKNCAPELAPILNKLFQLCYDQGTCPNSWKIAHVVPIPKKGDHSNPSNYRPIAITSIICKIMESIINEFLLNHLESHKLIHDHQYGFRKARSTGDILSYVTHLWSLTLDKSGESPVVALDISKAFDRVWHRCLLAKLVGAGVEHTLVTWIASFLDSRSIAVRVDGTISKTHNVLAGVPQGSVLSPTLFLVFINDLLSLTTSPIHSYADDSTLHHPIVHTTRCSSGQVHSNRTTATNLINRDLAQIVNWGIINLVNFNCSKTQAIVISRRKDTDHFPLLKMDGSVLQIKSTFNILGVTVTDSLCWSSHIKSICRAASRRLGILFRAKKLFSSVQRLVLYKAQVRPLLEYCSHIWGGAGPSILGLLDRVQSKAIRFVDEPTLTDSLQSLHHRRCVSALALFYRYYFGKCSEELASSVPLPLTFTRNTRAHAVCNPFRVTIPRNRTSGHLSSFFPRTSVIWNSLPPTAFPTSYNLQAFKRNINKLVL
jgi:hypothetical protein